MRGSSKVQIYYRGCLNFCNYTCSYCPFSKKAVSNRNLQQDQEQLKKFLKQVKDLKVQGAIQIIPYGEAMVHMYYWDAMAELSKNPYIDYVGVQSNLSFSVEQFVSRLKQKSTDFKKIRIWGTFHPEMTTRKKFRSQCEMLGRNEISYSVGMVGVPGEVQEAESFRANMPKECYVWINAMDGAKQSYSEEEIERLEKVDPFFRQELMHLPAEVSDCGKNYFVRGDGRIYACPISHKVIGDFYELPLERSMASLREQRVCKSKFCNCYLAYNNRKRSNHFLFGAYPAFRIPFMGKAIFFDIDGILLQKGERRISKETEDCLCELARLVPLYLATSRPIDEAGRVLGRAMHCFQGGVFSCGAHLLLWREKGEWADREIWFEHVYGLKESAFWKWMEKIEEEKKFRIKKYEKGRTIYKVTLCFPKEKKAEQFVEFHKEHSKNWYSVRMLREEQCVQMVSKIATKAFGAEVLCEQLGIAVGDIKFYGHGKEDEVLLGMCD